ncbi:MAG: type II secretion system F family protein, partial [Bdellovibrionota bacterium]
MPVFQYAGYDAQGRTKRGVVEADSPRGAKQRLRSQGVFVRDISETQVQAVQTKEIAKIPIRQLLQRISVQEVVIMTRQLATLVAAHIPLVQCLSALADQTEGLKLKAVIGQIKDDVNEGASLAAALRRHPDVFPPLYTSMVQSGEASGALDVVLLRLADFLDAQSELRGRVRGAMTYPVVMMAVGIGVVIFLMTSVVPKILTIFDAQRQTLPLPTQALQIVSHLMAAWWWVALILAGIAAYLIRRYISTPKGRRRWHEIALELPIFGPIIRKVSIARFARTLATLLSS